MLRLRKSSLSKKDRHHFAQAQTTLAATQVWFVRVKAWLVKQA